MPRLPRIFTAILLILILTTTQCASSGKRRSFGEVVDDEAVAFSLKTKYIKAKEVPANDILIAVWRGVVTLKGEVANQEQINRAIEIAEQQKGVKEVKAYLVLKQFGRLKEEPTRTARGGPFFKKWFHKRRPGERSRDTLNEIDLSGTGVRDIKNDAASQKTGTDFVDSDVLENEQEN